MGSIAAGVLSGSITGAVAIPLFFSATIIGPALVISMDHPDRGMPLTKMLYLILGSIGSILGAVAGVAKMLEKYNKFLIDVKTKKLSELDNHPIFS